MCVPVGKAVLEYYGEVVVFAEKPSRSRHAGALMLFLMLCVSLLFSNHLNNHTVSHEKKGEFVLRYVCGNSGKCERVPATPS